MVLPDAFVKQMAPLLGSEWADFAAAMSEAPTRGVRVQRYSVRQGATDGDSVPQAILQHLESPILWMPFGYYINERAPLGRTVFHEAGALYIQEPSAMAIARAIDPKPGERILDLCAAPGGKTTAIAALLQNQGQLVANEIHPTRVRILAENLERMGAAAAVVNHSPDELAAVWPEKFDAILVDAPCSGEGMFRKDPAAAQEWTAESPDICSRRQQDILRSAVKMLRPGGRLIYSTCTFNPQENERIVAWLEDDLHLTVEELPLWPGWSPGEPNFAFGRESLAKARRLWPHRARGEGHFVARLRKRAEHGTADDAERGKDKQRKHSWSQAWESWLAEHMVEYPSSWLVPREHKGVLFSDEVTGLPTRGLRMLRSGTPLASLAKDRIEPLHGIALRCAPKDFRFVVEVDEETAIAYMRGEALANDGGHKGHTVIVHQGLVLGWVKAIPGRLNNLYPKGWRKNNLVKLSTE
ncbi:NOL1/NOP2/sun family putative RNA methylase [Alicyclobacillus dauci]|uniref:NOL1/NOP2/sun family putative RNA methylase n=1 Tax=Alicyclobacillus dauci TaxID=1475485 RepID=A0ABY6Z6W4_9BACL|nr:NOL1/NOP2/sun family putative RNA methylase [Alicyclobacillus dauci]WAH38485.1 NOL1/NOP2/sun family putative RNA methylase [Alicyclobacillus dauci]